MLVTLRQRQADPALAERLRTLRDVGAVDAGDDAFRVHVTGTDRIVPQVVALAAARLRGLAVAEPSLATPCIGLTGRTLVP